MQLFRSVEVLIGSAASGFAPPAPRLLRCRAHASCACGRRRPSRPSLAPIPSPSSPAPLARGLRRDGPTCAIADAARAASLNSGDVFLLDLGESVLQWNGKGCDKKEKWKALEMSRHIRDAERGGKAKLLVFSEGTAPSKFWDALGGRRRCARARRRAAAAAAAQAADARPRK